MQTSPIRVRLALLVLVGSAVSTLAADWTQFRGPGGQGTSDEKNLPVKWSASENIAWQVDLPGPGASCPIVLGDRIFVTCYSGYGLEAGTGDQKLLMRHLLCVDRKNGQTIWHKQIPPKLPEHQYAGEGSYHGYAAGTPTADGERLYVFLGKSGVSCYDLEGNEQWQASVGDGTHGWGSGTSPLLYGKLLIINASVESASLVALDKSNGKEVWRAKGINASWNTPILAKAGTSQELVVSIQDQIVGLNPDTGEGLWRCEGVHSYVCPSVVSHDDVVYAIGGGGTSLAVRTGGRGDVTATHVVWRQNKGSNVGSPIYHEGHLYWAKDNGGLVCCQDAKTGQTVFEERLPGAGQIWSSALLADGKLYFVTKGEGTFVIAAKPQFELLAHNVIDDDNSRTNATPAVSHGQILLRTDRRLYCIGKP